MSLAVAVFGAGVIATVYGGLLAEAGDDVTLLARGSRWTDLQKSGLILQNADTGAAAFNACRRATRIP
jgi:2-dehydropantoate 2-reductase